MMQTYRLWFEEDKDIPQFKRLQFEKVEVPLVDVLVRGIHPVNGDSDGSSAKEKLVEVLNDAENKINEIEPFAYCTDVSCVTTSHYYKPVDPLEQTLDRIGRSVCFVDGLSYADLLRIAQERLRGAWSHATAHGLLQRVYASFDAMRSFLKKKDESVKLSGYADINNYDLGRVLTLDDFAGEDSVLIGAGMSITNFRSAGFLNHVTDEHGLLRLTDGIADFQMTAVGVGERNLTTLAYNCRRNGISVRFMPALKPDARFRMAANETAAKWGTHEGRYCFTTDIEHVRRMLDEEFKITFPTLNYVRETQPIKSQANLAESGLLRYSVGRYITGKDAAGSVKSVLGTHGVSKTGRKGQLLEKLAFLAANVYEQHESELDSHFGEHRYIRIASSRTGVTKPFPLLDDLDLRNMVLAMYIIKHLRGNTILEASHENDTFDLLSLAKALIKKEVSLDGSFLCVG
jgi:hypothetical protein